MDPEILARMAEHQYMIAPMVIAALIGAVGSMAAASMNKGEGAKIQGGGGSGINMKPTVDPQELLSTMTGDAGKTPQRPPLFGAGGEATVKANLQSPGAQAPMAAEIAKADQGENAGVAKARVVPGPEDPSPLTQGSVSSPGNVITPPPSFADQMGAVTTEGGPLKVPGKAGMSFDDKMQMAALVASLGSALAGPGAPPPPGAPRGGGIGMSPVFQQMTARGMYG